MPDANVVDPPMSTELRSALAAYKRGVIQISMSKEGIYATIGDAVVQVSADDAERVLAIMFAIVHK